MKDLNAEFSVVAGILKYGNGGMAEIRDIVTPTSFTDLKSRTLFDLTVKILEGQDTIDAATLISKTSALQVSHIITEDIISRVFSIHIELDSLRNLAKKIRRLEIINGAKNATKTAFLELDKLNGEENLSQIISTLEDPVLAFSNTLTDDEGVVHLFKDIDAYITDLEENPCDIVGLSTSFPTLDDAMGGGMRRGTVSLVGARSGVGKSMLGANAAQFNAKHGVPVLILDTEMSKEDNMQRHLASQSRITLDSIGRGTFSASKEMKLKVRETALHLKSLPISYKNVAGLQFEEILSICRRWIIMNVGVTAGQANDCLIVYDYFKLTDTQQLKNISEHEALGYQITKLTDFCQKYGATALTFVQLNRQGITIEDMSAISQSDRLNWLASNVVLFKDKTPEEIAECGEKWGNSKLIPIKTRFGPGLSDGDCIFTQKLGQYSLIQEVGTRRDMLKEKYEEDGHGEEDSD